MKCLTVTLDDMTVFSGEVAEWAFNETAESVTVSARFAPSPGLLDQLKQAAAAVQQNRAPSQMGESRPTLDVVRDNE